MYKWNGTVWYSIAQFGQVFPVSSLKTVRRDHYIQVVKSQLYPGYFLDTPSWIKTSEYECTHEMELFGTYFVWFGQVLAVSWMKTSIIIKSLYKWQNHNHTKAFLRTLTLNWKHQIMNTRAKSNGVSTRGNVFGRERPWETGSYRWLPREATMVPRLQTMQQLPLELTISGDTRLPAAIAGAYDIPRYTSPGSHAVNGLRHHAFRYVTYYQPPQQ